MADVARYLLPTERPVINIRRHWAVLVGGTLQSLLLFVVGVLIARILSGDFVRMVAIYFCVFVVVRWMWILGDWYVEKLVVTDKRVLLVTGIVTRKVAIMPLVKVTDLTFNRSATGLMLGYGQFVVETAGQDQALSHIDFVPKPEKLYIQISELLFGGDKGAPGALVTFAQVEAEEEADQLAPPAPAALHPAAATGRGGPAGRRAGRPGDLPAGPVVGAPGPGAAGRPGRPGLGPGRPRRLRAVRPGPRRPAAAGRRLGPGPRRPVPAARADRGAAPLP